MDIGGVTLCMLWRDGDLEQVAAYKSGHSASVRLQGRRRCCKRLLVLGRITAFKANLNLLIGVSCILSRAAGRDGVASLMPTTRQRRVAASMPKHTAKVESKKARRSGLFYEGMYVGIPFL